MEGLELSRLRTMVNVAAELTQEAREASERDRDYYDEHQWTQAERRVLEKRKQPVITINRIKRKVDAMIGIEQRQRIDPKAHPRQPNDEPVAQASTEALVFVDDSTRLDAKRSLVFENVVIEGYGAVEIVVEPTRDRQEIAINRLRWEELFFDPYGREKDFSDCSYIGTQKWMTMDSAVSFLRGIWEGSEDDLTEVLQTSLSNPNGHSTYEDRPLGESGLSWGDKKQRRVRVVQMYYKHDATWFLAIFTGGGVIYNEASPYLDEDGNPSCAIVGFAAYVDRENRRYGVVRSMISQQDEINKRRSKLLHQLNSRQTMGMEGAVTDVSAMKRELSDPQGHVEVKAEAYLDAAQSGARPWDIIPQDDQIAGQFSLLQESKSEIDMFGPNPSLIGQTEGGASGRAIMAQQQAGMAEMAPLYDGLRDWNIRVYKAMWARIKQFWTEERWVRIMDAEGQMSWTAFNQPQMAEVVDPATGMPMHVPHMANAPAEMDVDIIIEDVPDHVTLEQEQFEQLAQMASNGIPIPPELLIRASSVKDKGEILQMMKEQQQQAAQAQMQQAQAQAQLEQTKVQAAAQKDMATAQRTMAEVAETMADTKKTQVETQRLALGY